MRGCACSFVAKGCQVLLTDIGFLLQPRGGPAGPVAGAGIRRNDFNKPTARPPKVDDEHDFPSLG